MAAVERDLGCEAPCVAAQVVATTLVLWGPHADSCWWLGWGHGLETKGTQTLPAEDITDLRP